MSVSAKLKEFLDERRIPYRSGTHAATYTAQQTAEAAHVVGRAFAKPVLILADNRLWMAVVPAPDKIDLNRIRHSLPAKKVRLAAEPEFAQVFADCELGAMPIFGSLYGVPVIVSRELLENEEIAFSAGSHEEILQVKVSDFLSVEQPRVFERDELLAA